MSGQFGYGGGGYEGAALNTDEYATCRDPESGVQITVARDMIAGTLVYRVGWAKQTSPVPDNLLHLPLSRIAMEICLQECQKFHEVTAGEALRQIEKLCAIKSEGARLIYFRQCIEKAVAAERDRCMKLAEECGAFGIADRIQRGAEVIDADGTVARLDRWARADEREACAGMVERMAADAPGPTGPGMRTLLDAGVIAAAIRARKEKP